MTATDSEKHEHTHTRRRHTQRTQRRTLKYKHLNSLIACGDGGGVGGEEHKPHICLTAEMSGPQRKRDKR